ncbi:MAG: hypothetical protein Q8M77_03615 [Hydrogenophaga sp.]|nr:hypothetical protein [Hydrogenophaga sp.]
MKIGLDPYAAIGLTENPFLVHALSPDERGERLMVGRDDDIQQVATRLHKHGKITCLDGHVGVGKTSLVNVAAFKCFKAYIAGETPQLLIPSISSYQLKKDANVDQFCTEVFQGVAQTLIKYAEYIQHYDLPKGLQLPHLNAWLNSPVVQHLNGQVGVRVSAGFGSMVQASLQGGLAEAGQVNQSAGYAQSGFDAMVRQWLNEIFSVQGNGGVVCIIDNIELLETGVSARRTLEALRDKLFTLNGLRWVFCGANGVIHSLATSPRLTAFLSTPIIEVSNIHPASLSELIKARLAEFSTDPRRAEEDLPVEIEDLKHLYMIVNSNLRDLLALADEYCEFYTMAGRPIRSKEGKTAKFEKWLHKATFDRYAALQSRISANAWSVLDIAMSKPFSGTFGAGDYNSFNQNSTISFEKSTFSRWLRDLVKLGLLTKSIDDEQGEDDGFSRDVYTVTAKGALVEYARRKKNETYAIHPPAGDWMRKVHHPDN